MALVLLSVSFRSSALTHTWILYKCAQCWGRGMVHCCSLAQTQHIHAPYDRSLCLLAATTSTNNDLQQIMMKPMRHVCTYRWPFDHFLAYPSLRSDQISVPISVQISLYLFSTESLDLEFLLSGKNSRFVAMHMIRERLITMCLAVIPGRGHLKDRRLSLLFLV